MWNNTEEGAGMVVSNLDEDLREDYEQQQRQQQEKQQQQQQQQQRERRDLPNLNDPRPDSDLSETINATTDDDNDMQDLLEEDQEHAVGQESQNALTSTDGEAVETPIYGF